MTYPIRISCSAKRPLWASLGSRVIACLICAAATAHAATYTWDGGGKGGKVGNFNEKQNWGNTGGAPGGITDDLIFTSTVGSSSTPTLSANAATRSITFNAGAAAFTIGGAFALTLGSGGIVNNSSNSETFSVQTLTLAAAQTWSAALGNLNFSGLSIANGGFALTIDGAKNTSISAAITGAGGLTKKGVGILTLTNAGNNYGGITDVQLGKLLYGNSNVLGPGGVNVSGGTLDIVSFSDTVGTVTLVSGSIMGTTGVLTGLAYDLRSGTVSAILGGIGAALTKSTAGLVTLSNANTYTGATTVSAGTLALTSTGSIASTSNLSIAAGATFQTANAFSLAGRNLQIAIASATSNGFLTAGGALTYGGSITLTIAGTYTAQSWNLLDFTSQTGGASSFTLAGSYNGTLSNSGDIWTGVVGGQNWTFNETNGVLTVIPEPGTPATLAVGVGALLVLQRARRRLKQV